MRIVKINAPTVDGRDRRWSAMFRGDEVFLVNYLILEPGEEIDDNPPSETISLTEFKQRHAEFKLTADGRPL